MHSASMPSLKNQKSNLKIETMQTELPTLNLKKISSISDMNETGQMKSSKGLKGVPSISSRRIQQNNYYYKYVEN